MIDYASRLCNPERLQYVVNRYNLGPFTKWAKEMWLCCHSNSYGRWNPWRKGTITQVYWNVPEETYRAAIAWVATWKKQAPPRTTDIRSALVANMGQIQQYMAKVKGEIRPEADMKLDTDAFARLMEQA